MKGDFTMRAKRTPPRLCDVADCGQIHFTHGLCRLHWNRMRRCGSVEPQPTIAIDAWFWSKVQKTDGCWLRAGTTARRYWQVQFQGRIIRAHRLAYELARGPIPTGMYVCHHCDNPPCVNPAHLFLGTPADNMADMVRKGRSRFPGPDVRPRGERNARAKLRAEHIPEIRRMRATGVSVKAIADRFAVTKHAIECVIHRQTWGHIE